MLNYIIAILIRKRYNYGQTIGQVMVYFGIDFSGVIVKNHRHMPGRVRRRYVHHGQLVFQVGKKCSRYLRHQLK